MTKSPTFALTLFAAMLTSGARSRADAPTGRYTNLDVSGIPAVRDTVTGLTWMRNELRDTYMWENAKMACNAVGAGWRLPNVMELTNLVDLGKTSAPTIDTSFFQGPTVGSAPRASSFWSSSVVLSVLAWYVDLRDGGINTNPVSSGSLGVRCVR